uniref:LysM and putative peptidoglycan-binding domain-containing protein 2 n=1 Tax=Talaromyces marneffei PM1 TaxID=1077442 RepID=A0A093V8Z9_TALMA
MLGSGVDYNYCLNSLTNWSESVEQACQGQTVLQSGVIVEAKALSLSFTHNADIACLQDSQDNWCFFESQTWQGSDYIRYDPAMCWNDEDNPTICDDPDFDISSLTEDMMAITNLYNTSLTVMPTTVTVTTDITVAPTPTCLGQVVQPISNWLTCNDLCDQYNVSTGDARLATGDPDCYFDSPICLPPPCYIQPVWNSPSCESLAKLASNTTYNVSETQFLSWNGNILGSCDGVANGQRICLQAPGGTYPSPSVTIVAPTGTAYYTTATPAYPTQSGTITDCGLYYQVGTSDDCSTVDLRFGITFSQLKKLNTYLDDSCSNLWLNYDICVAEVVQPAISTDGSCGLGVTCIGSTFGSCCSPTGQCTNDCGSPGNSTVSTDGSCGPNNGFRTCPGSGFGDCCSTPSSVVQAIVIPEPVLQIMAGHPPPVNVALSLQETRLVQEHNSATVALLAGTAAVHPLIAILPIVTPGLVQRQAIPRPMGYAALFGPIT